MSEKRIAAVLVVIAVGLVPWTLALAYRLPSEHTSRHWDLAWIGFDAALACALLATGIGVVRRADWVQAVAASAATLLLCDAWFDTVLARSGDERLEAVLSAVLAELPLAFLCLWLARNAERTVAALRP
jgi:hypothetical protein